MLSSALCVLLRLQVVVAFQAAAEVALVQAEVLAHSAASVRAVAQASHVAILAVVQDIEVQAIILATLELARIIALHTAHPHHTPQLSIITTVVAAADFYQALWAAI